MGSNRQESIFLEKKAVAKSVLDLTEALLPYASRLNSIGSAALESCLRLAPDMAMIGFLDSGLLLSYLRMFAVNRSFKGIDAHVQQAKLLDQAAQLMEVYCRDHSPENDSDYIQDLIGTVSQGIEYLLEVVPSFSSQGRKVIPLLLP